VNEWRGWFGGWLHPSFALFVLLVVAACATGLGAPSAAPVWRRLFAPHLVVLFGGIGLFSWT
jgi:hypothetical protein